MDWNHGAIDQDPGIWPAVLPPDEWTKTSKSWKRSIKSLFLGRSDFLKVYIFYTFIVLCDDEPPRGYTVLGVAQKLYKNIENIYTLRKSDRPKKSDLKWPPACIVKIFEQWLYSSSSSPSG